MKDEIKEKIKAYYIGNDIDKALDYITDLQDRIKELEQINEDHRKLNGNLRTANNTLCEVEEFMYNQAKEYKARIDKAIEYMKKWGEEPDADMYMQMKQYKEFQYLLNILQGKSDE